MRFSLIIPCFNEAKNIPLLLERCGEIAKPGEIEIILVDNGSTDESQAVLLEIIKNYPGCRSIRVEVNRGYGFGILSGLRAAHGDILGWTHADMQTDPADALAGLQYFDKYDGALFCKGRRFGRPIFDVLFTIGMSLFESILLRKFMWDINAQPTMFSRGFFETWTDPPEDFSLDLYAYFMAKAQRSRICRFPVKFSTRAFGVSHWNISWKAKFNFIKRTLIYSFRLKRGLSK
jgi:glycosyltransferase involved in cell wall biosynthesis